ncbi:hypothetical protein [Paenibacillus sp. HJGM_3]|uniref:hypothetical protein n=1 Tax=Paenibacillus sp. HJGM_3 TaxID=3379816 RepID=UPI00385A0B2B
MNLNEIKEALSKATPGTWKGKHAIKPYITVFTGVADEVIATVEMRNNLQLLSNAPEWLASLVSQLETAKDVEHELIKMCDDYKRQLEEAQKTLEWYAADYNWDGILHGTSEIHVDGGDRARETLKRLRGENQ